MKQNEIIDKLLFQAGAHFGGDGINYEEFDFRKFAKLVADKKQEDIIKVIERLGTWAHIEEVVNAIRARGQA